MKYAYEVVFTIFNFGISLLYYVYGFIIYRKKARKIKHSDLSKEQVEFLRNTKFVNVHYKWIKKFGVKIWDFSILYFVFSEIACVAGVYFTKNAVLICRISFFAAVALLLLWIYLLVYYNKKDKEVELQHKKNLERRLKKFEEQEKKSKQNEEKKSADGAGSAEIRR